MGGLEALEEEAEDSEPDELDAFNGLAGAGLAISGSTTTGTATMDGVDFGVGAGGGVGGATVKPALGAGLPAGGIGGGVSGEFVEGVKLLGGGEGVEAEYPPVICANKAHEHPAVKTKLSPAMAARFCIY